MVTANGDHSCVTICDANIDSSGLLIDVMIKFYICRYDLYISHI